MSGELFSSGTELAGGRFVVTNVIASGGQATTYEGLDKSNGARVAIKRFSVRGASSWKEVELAEREARVLSALSHPGLPKVVTYFEEEGALYLVLEYIEGATLEELKRSHHLSQQDVSDYLHQLSEILEYLHQLSPPVFHRDIKPRNVIRRPNGQIVLVDFGSVRDKLEPSGGSTVVGTFGYMAPEQFQGRAMPGSDVYGAAATALALFTGQDPDQLPHQGLKLDVERAVGHSVSPAMRRFLTAALEPNPDERPRSLRRALAQYGVQRGASEPASRREPGSNAHSETKTADQYASIGQEAEEYGDYGAPPFPTPGYRRNREHRSRQERRREHRDRQEERAARRARRRARRAGGRDTYPEDTTPLGRRPDVDVETPLIEVLAMPEVRRALKIPLLGLVAVIFLVVLRILLWAVLGIVVPRVLHVLQKVTGAQLREPARQTMLVGTTLRDQLTRVTGRVRELEGRRDGPRYRVADPEDSRSDFQRLADDFEARAQEFENETQTQQEQWERARKK